jgi:hypothetical protein
MMTQREKGQRKFMKSIGHWADLQRTLEEVNSGKSGDHMPQVRCALSKASWQKWEVC